ncbi:hypothetical protein GF406_12595, partial [candidate division KSB1 bacterium]|nr:hypothetical protein [candidate division KSB1 bacterium]
MRWEREQHQKFVEDMYAKTYDLLKIFGFLISGILAVVGFTTVWGIRKAVHNYFFKHAKSEIDKEINAFRSELERNKRLLDQEIAYKNKKIIFFTHPADKDQLEKNEIELVYKRGISYDNLIIETDIRKLENKIQSGIYDLILYYYHPNKNETDPQLHAIIDMLKTSEHKIPIIIYNYKKPGINGRLFNSDGDKI